MGSENPAFVYMLGKVENNKGESILNTIAHIRMLHLQLLNLKSNAIISIEALPRISMPCLRELLLGTSSLTQAITTSLV
jgi:hypothetical protein